MAASSPSKASHGKKTTSSMPMPKEQDLIAFNHVAAGHEGMTSNASGSLVIKPCTQAEIDFYESAKYHENIQVHIPTYIGMLALNQDQNLDDITPLLAQAGLPLSTSHAPHASIASLPPISELLSPVPTPNPSHNATSAPITAVSAKRASWKPSGGKKLETGLAIVLENVAAGFKCPNILDVKLGARLWADDAPMSKRRKLDEVSKETTSGSLGFRIAGMKMWVLSQESEHKQDGRHAPEPNVELKDGYKSYNKHYGRTFTAENVKDGFAEYLGGLLKDEKTGTSKLKKRRAKSIANRVIRELESMQYVLENEESRMYSASVLVVYEGDEEALEAALEDEKNHNSLDSEQDITAENECEEEDDDVDEDQDEPPKVCDVRLIDFAHANWAPGQGPDENTLQGVREVKRILEEIVSGQMTGPETTAS